MTDDLLQNVIEQVRPMMRRLAALGRPFTHTVWERDGKVNGQGTYGFLIYRAQPGNTTPIVVWLDKTDDGYALLVTRRVGDREIIESTISFGEASIARLESRLKEAFS